MVAFDHPALDEVREVLGAEEAEVPRCTQLIAHMRGPDTLCNRLLLSDGTCPNAAQHRKPAR